MTKDQKMIKGKVGLLELAKQLGNVSQACKMLGYSRASFSRFKELYGPFDELRRRRARPAGDEPQKPVLANRPRPGSRRGSLHSRSTSRRSARSAPPTK